MYLNYNTDNEFIEDPFDADRDYQIEEKSDQFMGATIVSTGEHVLVSQTTLAGVALFVVSYVNHV